MGRVPAAHGAVVLAFLASGTGLKIGAVVAAVAFAALMGWRVYEAGRVAAVNDSRARTIEQGKERINVEGTIRGTGDDELDRMLRPPAHR